MPPSMFMWSHISLTPVFSPPLCCGAFCPRRENASVERTRKFGVLMSGT